MSDLDNETRAAISALVHRLRNPGDADPLGADAEPFAAEFIAALKARGWRPVLAVPVDADWRRASGSRKPRGALDPDAREALFSRMAEATRATMDGTRKTGPHQILTEDDDLRPGAGA
jgi:hypothetical protein